MPSQIPELTFRPVNEEDNYIEGFVAFPAENIVVHVSPRMDRRWNVGVHHTDIFYPCDFGPFATKEKAFEAAKEQWVHYFTETLRELARQAQEKITKNTVEYKLCCTLIDELEGSEPKIPLEFLPRMYYQRDTESRVIEQAGFRIRPEFKSVVEDDVRVSREKFVLSVIHPCFTKPWIVGDFDTPEEAQSFAQRHWRRFLFEALCDELEGSPETYSKTNIFSRLAEKLRSL